MIPCGNRQLAEAHDLLTIVLVESTGRYHVSVWEEKPLPGASPPRGVVRLKSKMAHTTGATSFEEALVHVAKLRERLSIDDQNVWTRPDQVFRVPTPDDLVTVRVLPDWRSDASAAN